MELYTLDLGQFSTGSPAERAAIAQAFDGAFRTAGFCYLTGYEHLLPEATIDALRAQSTAFFALPAAEKEKSRVDGEIGYLGPGAENIAASAGAASAQPDLVESLNLPAYQEPAWHVSAAEAECPWRDEAWLPTAAFRAAAVAYFGGVNRVMTELYSLAELALELPPSTLGAAFEHPGTLLRLAWYPPCDDAQGAEGVEGAEGGVGRLRYGAHTDFDGFTILQRGEEQRGGARGADARRRVGCGRRATRHPHDQHRRPAAAVDQRSVEEHAPPRRSRHDPRPRQALGRLLHRAAPRHRGRVPALAQVRACRRWRAQVRSDHRL